ncbi:MAG: TolC family protein [Chitinispirillaceae bacterium]|nr:TolC family protein [Chitinispirillaceae bacterium]
MNSERVRMPIFTSVITALLVAIPYADTVELSLQQAIDLTMKNNASIKAMEHQITAAKYGIKSAVTGFLPKVATTVTARHQSGNDMISQLLRKKLDNSYSIGLEIQQPIFTGFATLNALRSAKTSYALQEATSEKTQQSIRYAVTRIYWGLVSLRKSGDVADEAVKQLEELTANQKALLEQGMAAEHDVLLTEASLEQARLNVLTVEKSLKSTQRQFSIYLGLPVESEIVLSDSLSATSETTTFNSDSLLQTALQNRPDLKEANLQLSLSETGIKLSRAAYYPTLAAGFSFSETRPDQSYNDTWGNSWYLYAALNFNIFDWGDRIFKVKKAQSQHLSLIEQVEQKREMVKKEVLDANESVVQNAKTLDVTLKLQEAQKRSYEATVAKYEEGVIPLYELLNIHSNYIGAKYKVLEASANLELARINLEMGGIGSGLSQ